MKRQMIVLKDFHCYIEAEILFALLRIPKTIFRNEDFQKKDSILPVFKKHEPL